MPDPTVTDVFNQLVLVNGKLDQVEVNTSMLTNLNASINAGFAETVNALGILAQINIEAVKLLYHQTQQADTMICALDQIAERICELVSQSTQQTALQTRLQEDVEVLRHLTETAQPEAALEYQRQAAIQAEIERCCPPEPPGRACEHEACERPEPARQPELPEVHVDPEQPHKPVG